MNHCETCGKPTRNRRFCNMACRRASADARRQREERSKWKSPTEFGRLQMLAGAGGVIVGAMAIPHFPYWV